MEPGEARAKALAGITGQIVSLRRSNQERAWLSVAAQKAKMALIKLEVATGIRVPTPEPEVPQTVSDEALNAVHEIVNAIMGTMDNTDVSLENIEIETVSPEDGERMIRNIQDQANKR